MRWVIAMVLVILGFGCGGSDWDEVDELPDLLTVEDVWAFATDDVWAVGAQGTLLAYDGNTWTESQLPTSEALTGIFALGRDDVWVTADQTLLHWNGSDWTTTDTEPFGVDGITDVWAASPSAAWAVGDDGILLVWDGVSWSRELFPSTFNQAVWGSGPDDLYVLGVFGLYHWDGGDWVSVDTGGSGGEGDIWGTGADDVWVATDDSELAHWDGATWTRFDNDTFIGGIAGLWGTGPDDIWGVGSFGAIAHFDGDRWDEVRHDAIGSSSSRYFRAIHGSSSSDLWAVGQILGAERVGGIIFHYQP